MTTQSRVLGALRSITQPIDWDEIYTSELPRVYNFFIYKIGDRDFAQDLTAITFERAWKLRSRYRATIASPSTWLFGIARNILKEYLRKSRKNKHQVAPISHTEQLLSNVNIEQWVQQEQDKEHLRKIILELPEREQELIALKYGAGLTNREIAKITKLSESNVGSILHRTVNRLRNKWDDNHG
jgi:RNA polymerase sigma-70 factor (ECF subfamily)